MLVHLPGIHSVQADTLLCVRQSLITEWATHRQTTDSIILPANYGGTPLQIFSTGICWSLGHYTQFWGSLSRFVDAMSIDQSHRYGCPQAACHEPAGSYDQTTRTAICFEHKTQYLLIRAPYTRIVVFWHISNIPPMISQSQISCNTPTFYIAAIFVKYCYTTGSWLL